MNVWRILCLQMVLKHRCHWLLCAPALHIQNLCRTESKEACMADCAANEDCACAFYREGFSSPWCAMTDVPCNAPNVGAAYHNAEEYTALHKCAAAWAEGDPVAPEEDSYDPVDWYGIWDFVCESPSPFEHMDSNTRCGPPCVLDGYFTTMCGPLPDCMLSLHCLVFSDERSSHLQDCLQVQLRFTDVLCHV